MMLHPWFVPMVMAAERPHPQGISNATRNMEAEMGGAKSLNSQHVVLDTIALEYTPRATRPVLDLRWAALRRRQPCVLKRGGVRGYDGRDTPLVGSVKSWTPPKARERQMVLSQLSSDTVRNHTEHKLINISTAKQKYVSRPIDEKTKGKSVRFVPI